MDQSLKPIPGLEFATIDLRMVAIHSGVAIGPAQEEIRTQREHNGRPVHFGFNAHSLCPHR